MHHTVSVTVDRIEGEYYVAVAEDGERTYDIPRSLGEAEVNDLLVLTLDGDNVVSFARDREAGQKKAAENLSRLHALFNRKK